MLGFGSHLRQISFVTKILTVFRDRWSRSHKTGRRPALIPSRQAAMVGSIATDSPRPQFDLPSDKDTSADSGAWGCPPILDPNNVIGLAIEGAATLRSFPQATATRLCHFGTMWEIQGMSCRLSIGSSYYRLYQPTIVPVVARFLLRYTVEGS